MVIYDQVLSERLLQFNDVCRCQLVIADDVGFAEALDRVLFCNINGVGVADVVEIVHEWLPLYMLTCAHIEQRLMPNPQRFEGLEEDITWYSNRGVPLQAGVFGLEEDKITWYSNAIPTSFQIWEAEKITGFSNMDQICSNACAVWEAEEITGFSNGR